MLGVDSFNMRIFTRNRVIVVVGVLALGTVLLSVHRRRVDKVWQEMLDTGAELERSIDSLDGRRAVLYGKPLEGKAQEQYTLAIESLSESFSDDWKQYNTAREQGDEQATSLRDALVEANLAALGAISAGTHLSDASFDLDWASPAGQATPRIFAARNLVILSIMTTHKLLADGEYQAGGDTLLDGLQVAGDFMRSPLPSGQMIGCIMLELVSVEALIEQGLLDRLPVNQLERVSKAMDQLITHMPSRQVALGTEMAWFIRMMSVFTDSPFGLPNLGLGSERSVGARYWFSFRLMVSEYVGEVMAWRASSAAFGEPSWGAWSAEFDERTSRMADLGNPLWELFGFNLRKVVVKRRRCLTRFNMARLAVAYRLTGETIDLPDLFGDQLLVRLEGDQLRIDSVGPGDGSTSLEGLSIQAGI